MKMNLITIILFFLGYSLSLNGQSFLYSDGEIDLEKHWDSGTIIDLIMNDETSHAFLMASTQYSNRTMTVTDLEKGKIIFQGLELVEVISDLKDIPKGQINVHKGFKGKKYDFYYSNPDVTPNDLVSEFCDRVIDAVSLNMKDVKKEVEIYELTMKDSSLLVPTTSSPGQSGTGFYGSGEYHFSNKDFDQVLEIINDKLDSKFVSNSGLGTGYDFNLNISSLESIVQSLESYGFSISMGNWEITFYELY